MQLARVQPMPTRQSIAPVLASYPEAKWLTGANQAAKDTAKKTSTSVDWSAVTLRAEEMAVLVPIPDAYVQDTGVDLFSEIKPLLGMAFGRKIDAAALFDVDNPWNTGGGIFQQAIAAGNYVDLGATTDPVTGNPQDLGQDLADCATLLEDDGFDLSGWASYSSFKWRLVKQRSTTGEPIYAAGDMSKGQPATIYGEPYAAVKNGTWDRNKALAIAGDWEYARVGVRQDITFSISDSAVMTNSDGTVAYNAYEQDGKILRAVMRVAFAIQAPKVTPVNEVNPFPFCALRPASPHLAS
jgi:HK97 family phage major capsid protein